MELTHAIRAYINHALAKQGTEFMAAIDILSTSIDTLQAEFEAYKATATTAASEAAAVAAQKAADDNLIASQVVKIDALTAEIKALVPVPVTPPAAP